MAATIVVAGLFAFAPVEQASTVHESVSASISGAPTVLTATVLTATNINNITEWHQVVLTSEVPYTIHDIEVDAEITQSAGNDGCDEIDVEAVAFPAEYGSDGGPLSFDEGTTESMFGEREILDGDDDFDSLTWSMSAQLADDGHGLFSFTENTNVLFQVNFQANSACVDNDVDFTADVTFYLSGATEDEVELFVDADVAGGDEI